MGHGMLLLLHSTNHAAQWVSLALWLAEVARGLARPHAEGEVCRALKHGQAHAAGAGRSWRRSRMRGMSMSMSTDVHMQGTLRGHSGSCAQELNG